MQLRGLIGILLLAVMVMAADNALGRIRPMPVDADLVMKQYFRLVQDGASKEVLDEWMAKKSEAELASIPIVMGYGLLNEIEGSILTDSLHYKAYMSALKLIEKGFASIDKTGDECGLYLKTDDADIIPARYILANAYDKVLRYNAADSAYIKTAEEIYRDYGADSEEFVFWTNQCAESLQRKNKNYSKAIALLLPVKDAALHSPEVADTTACAFLISLAQKYQLSGNHSEAKSLAHEAEKRAGDDRRFIFQVSNILAELYWIEGQHDKGGEYFSRAQSHAPSLLEFFAAGINCANILRQTGHVNKAETTLLALGKYLDYDGLTAEDLFHYYESLGVLYTFSDPEKSAENFRKAEKYIDYINYPDLIRHVLNSQVYPNADNSFKTIEALDRAETVLNMFIGDEPRLLNELLALKGHYLMVINDYKTARKYCEAAYINSLDYALGDPQRLELLRQLARLDEIDGEDVRRRYYLGVLLDDARAHGETSEPYLNAVADVLHYCLQTADEDGAKHYFEIYERQRPDAFDTYCYKCRITMLQGKDREAERLLGEMKDAFPDERATVNLMLQRFYSSRKSPKIASVADSVFADFKGDMLQRLLFMSNSERRNMDSELRSKRDEIISAISFAPDVTELALDYSLFSKGLLFHTQTEIDRLLADSDSARMEMAIISGLKVDLTRAINRGDKEASRSIQGGIDSRERYLVDDFLDNASFAERFGRYSARELCSSVSPSCILMDFVEFADGADTRIGCFVIENGSPVRFVDLCKSSDLSDKNAYRYIWAKILAGRPTNKRIFFSTDGCLNTLLVEFAEDSGGRPVCEKYDMHRVFHLSDIRPSESIGTMVEAIGVADHNSPSGAARRLDDGYRGNWGNLPGVETELYRIAESLDGVTDFHRAFNDDATEAYIKNLSGTQVTTLHISTHGFYRGEEELTKAYNDTADFDHNIARRTLMGGRNSLSGLVMRNGNLSWRAETITGDEDNILTSEEVEALSFPDLQLTVLSACETGLGELSADGVWGLQRAFRIAGSGSLICSLRRVNDTGTADFMAEFYRQAASGFSVHDAFYNARKELLLHDPSNKEVWSSFILIE